MQIILLTVFGFILILLDILFVPGGIFIVMGSCAILYSIYLTFEVNTWLALLHLASSLALVPFIVRFAFNRLALKEEMRKEDGFVGVDDHSAYIGKAGIARSNLRPSGSVVVIVDGEEEYLDCISEGGLIEKGSQVVITEDRGTSLVVRLASDIQG